MEASLARRILLVATAVLLVLGARGVKPKEKNQPDSKKNQPVPVDLKNIGPEDVKPIFDVMRQYGEGERDQVNSGQNIPVNQYLVVTVVSEKELRDAKNWQNGFPEHFTKKDGEQTHRVVFLLNKKGHSEQYYNPNRELHGEVNSIDHGSLRRLIDNFNEDHAPQHRYPFVLMYSHFIPCAKVPKLGYSCSEEIKNFATGKGNELGVLVGYTTFFKNTDVEASLRFMKEGGVVAFQAMAGSYKQTVKWFPPSSIDGKRKAFQGEFYDCLMNLPVSQCCTGVQKNREKIVSFFVNEVTYTCTAYSKASHGLTERSRRELRDRIGQQIDQRMGDDCIECSKKNPEDLMAAKFLMKFCLDFSLKVSDSLGKPQDPFDPYSPNWVPCADCAWKDMYRSAPKHSSNVRHRVMCANWKLDKDSLCTKTDNSDVKKQKKLLLNFEKFEQSSKTLPVGDRYVNFLNDANRLDPHPHNL